MRNFCQFVLLPVILVVAVSSAAPGAAPRQPFSDENPTPTASRSSRKGTSSSVRQSTIVVIDAGHGGFDRGGIPRQAVPEKVMTLDVALRLRSILQQAGYRVVMTRDSDVFVPLPQRVAIANSYRNGIFICIHFNSATRAGANGIETYFYSRDSLPLASAIHYHVVGGAPSPNRGVRRRGYYVLRKTTIPAVLVECGFLTNPWEARNVESSAYRESLAQSIAAGIQGRSAVVARTNSSSQLVAQGTIPLQPFIDQTHVRDPDISHSKRSRRSKRKSSTQKSSSLKSGGELAENPSHKSERVR